jgi:hypothetical protein
MSSDQPASLRTPLPPREAQAPAGRRPLLLLAVAAGFCWACAIALLLFGGLESEHTVLAAPRVIFYTLVLAAGLLTFVPTQRQLQLPRLTLEGVAGTFILLYALAFLPPPTGWLLDLPELPVYLIFAAATFWTCSAIGLPLIYALGKRLFRQRARQYDVRRARRQSHEIGALVALCVGLAGLRVLTLVGVALLLLILFVAELLFLSFIETQA